MPVNTLKQAQIMLSAAQMTEIGELAATTGGRQGARIEETNITNAIAVVTIPSKKIHLIAWDGKTTVMGQEK